jgi:hypothetical protein
MASSKQIVTDELDFEGIRTNLKTFLSAQDTLKDYNFEGSALSTLIDVLAYNTHYNSLYTNLAVNEMFIDSASKYSSVVSLAKTIGYTASSVRSARAKLTVTVTLPVGENPATLTLPIGTIFSGSVGDEQYYFNTITSYTAFQSAGVYTFTDVEIVEGTPISKRYTASPAAQYVVPNKFADTSSLNVKVQDNVGISVFTYANDLLNVTSTSAVYFIKQREDLYYEVYFGDGNLGKAVDAGNIVSLSYNKSSGSAANGVSAFDYSSGFRGDVTYEVVTTTSAQLGSDAETIDSIRFNAPRAYIAQNRCVTTDDYINLLYSSFPEIESLTAWGGQDHYPRTYGKVFIAAKPFNSETLTAATKFDIVNLLLKNKNIVAVTPEIVDPLYLRVELTANVYYNPAVARNTIGEITTAVRNTITEYAGTLNKFESSFRFSRLMKLIDSSDDSIVSNITTLRVRSPVTPQYNTLGTYDIRFENPISSSFTDGGNFWSTRFYESTQTDRCFLKDDGQGVVQLFSEDISGIATYVRDVGTLTYGSGIVSVPSMKITGLYDPELEFVFIPSSNDVIPARSYIVRIPPELVTVNILTDSLSAGNAGGGTNYTFSASR